MGKREAESPDETGGRLLQVDQFPSFYWWASDAKADRADLVQLALFAPSAISKRKRENQEAI
jgi:hypothetical protein